MRDYGELECGDWFEGRVGLIWYGVQISCYEVGKQWAEKHNIKRRERGEVVG